jgi:hypothetical protein
MKFAAETVELLKAAKVVLNDYGWIQGDTGNRHVGFCALGAVREAATGQDFGIAAMILRPNAYDALVDASRSEALVPVSTFNDTPGRTKDEVLALFDRAIAQVESGESI